MNRTITIETTAGPVVFRTPNLDDLWELLGTLPLLLGMKETEAEARADTIDKAFSQSRKNLAQANELLIACAEKPKIIARPEKPDPLTDADRFSRWCVWVPPEGVILVDHLTVAERMRAFAQLCKSVEFTKEAAERLDPTSPTAEASSSSTRSESGTESSPLVS